MSVLFEARVRRQRSDSIFLDIWREDSGGYINKIGSKHEILQDIMVRNEFGHMKTSDNLVTYEEDEFKIKNLVTKKDKKAEMEEVE